MAVLADLSQAELLARVEELEAKLERQRQASQRRISLKVSEKGALSLYGLGRFPVTLYKSQWLRLLDECVVVRQFITDNTELLAEKGAE